MLVKNLHAHKEITLNLIHETHQQKQTASPQHNTPAKK
jgi:hypothetical protein